MASVPSQNPSASEVTGMLACCQAGVYVHVLAPSLDPPESAAKQPAATSCPESRAVRPLTVPPVSARPGRPDAPSKGRAMDRRVDPGALRGGDRMTRQTR